MSVKWGEEYWSSRPCSMSLVSLCQLWCLRPCRSWPRSELHLLEPPSWLVPSESYQAVLPAGPTFPCSRPAEPGLRMPGGDLTQIWKGHSVGSCCPVGALLGGRRMPLSDALCSVCDSGSGGAWLSAPAPAPPPPAPPPPVPCPGAFTLCTRCTAVPSGPNSAILFICTQGAPPLLEVQGFDPFTTFMSLSPLSSYT